MTSPSAMKYAVSVGVISMVARSTIPVSPFPPTVAQKSSALFAVRGEVADLSVGGQQVHRAHMVAEAARAVVVLAVDVGGDRAADGDLPGARQHRHPQPERQRRLHQLVEVDAGVDVGQLGVGVDRVDAVQRRHVDDQAAAVLRVVAVGAAQPAGDDAPALTPPRRRPGPPPWRSPRGPGWTAPAPPTVRCGSSPVSRVWWWKLLLNIVKEGTAWRSGSADPEDHGSLHNEIDHRGGALRDHERDRYRPGPVVQERQA